MNDRDELIKELVTKHCWRFFHENDIYELADFILNDRKRIVQPLVKYVAKREDSKVAPMGTRIADEYILATLKLSGEL